MLQQSAGNIRLLLEILDPEIRNNAVRVLMATRPGGPKPLSVLRKASRQRPSSCLC